MAESSLMSQAYTDSNSRCMKCVFVVLEVFPEIMQRIMEQSGISAKSLYNRIQKDQHFRERLTQTAHQTIKTLVSDGYTKLDLTLMFKIIIHYSYMFINPPTRGWTSDPLSSEITIGDDTQRLRLKRNHFLHKVTIELSEKDCNIFFSELTLICERVDRYLNCTEEESFKSRIKKLNSQPFVAPEELKKQYDKEKGLEEYFVTEIGNHEFRVFKAKSLKNFTKEITERRDHHDGSCSAIKLTFPDISNSEFTKIMRNLRELINKELVNIDVESISDGSLVMDIVVKTSVLLTDEGLKKELVTLLTRLLTIRECEDILNTLPVVTIVLSESLACFNDCQDENVEDDATMYPKGSIQLNLRVNNNILQSEEILKSEVERMFDTVVSHSNGNTIFPSAKPVVAVIEPGVNAKSGDDGVIGTEWNKKTSCQRHLKAKSEKLLELKSETPIESKIPKLDETIFPNEKSKIAVKMSKTMDSHSSSAAGHIARSHSDKALNQTNKEPGNQHRGRVEMESLNLQLLHRSDTGTPPLRHGRIFCCTLPNGLMVITGHKYNTILITKADGTLQSMIELPQCYNNFNDVTSTGKNCVAFSCCSSRVILIIDVIKNEIVEEIETKHCPFGITFKEGYILYCAYHGYIVKLDIDHGNKRSDESDLLIQKHKDEDHFKISGKKYYLQPRGIFSRVLAEEEIVYRDRSIDPLSAIASSNDRICYYDGDNTVTVLDSKYNVVYKSKKLNIRDITIDHRGVVYIIGRRDNNLSAISPDGKTVRDLLNEGDYLMRPSCVHYDRYSQQLIVAGHGTAYRYSIYMS